MTDDGGVEPKGGESRHGGEVRTKCTARTRSADTIREDAQTHQRG